MLDPYRCGAVPVPGGLYNLNLIWYSPVRVFWLSPGVSDNNDDRCAHVRMRTRECAHMCADEDDLRCPQLAS